MLYEPIFSSRIITGPCHCVLAHTSAGQWHLFAKIQNHASDGYVCIGIMSLKRPWSKLQLIKKLLICMLQICWNNLHWGNFSSFQASATTHPGSSQVVEGGRCWWKGKFRIHAVTALPAPCLKSELCWATAGPDPWHSVCHVPHGSAKHSEWPLLTWVLCPARMLPPPCRTPGACEGLPEFEKCFLREIKSSCNMNL